MTQQHLDGAYVGTGFQQMDGKCAPKGMRCDRLGNMATLMRLLASLLYGESGDVAADSITWEKPPFGLVHSPPVAQDFEELRGEHDIAIFLSFTLLDSDEHPLTVDIGDLQADRLRDPQSGGVAGRQDCAMLDAPHTGQKLQDFFLSQDHRQLLRFFGRWNYFFQVPSPMERDFIEETKSRYSDDNRAWSELPFVREINLVRANLLRSQYLG